MRKGARAVFVHWDMEWMDAWVTLRRGSREKEEPPAVALITVPFDLPVSWARPHIFQRHQGRSLALLSVLYT